MNEQTIPRLIPAGPHGEGTGDRLPCSLSVVCPAGPSLLGSECVGVKRSMAPDDPRAQRSMPNHDVCGSA